MKKSFYFLILILLIACESKQGPLYAQAKLAGLTPNVINELDELIPQWQQTYKVPNVGIGLIEDGKIIQAKVYGHIDEIGPAPTNALFNVASVTKVIVSTLTMKLVEAELWDLDEPLAKYFIDPDVKDDPRHKVLTTRHVLSQQSGFANWRWNHPTEKLTFEFEPGTEFQYSGEGMEYLRLALESKFEKSLSQLSNEYVFKPLEMIDSYHDWDGVQHKDRFCKWYNTNGELYDIKDYSCSDNAADDLTTTVGDLSKFSLDVINGSGLSIDLFAEVIKTQTAINSNLQQGLGWRVVNDLPNDEFAIQHGGNDIGVAAIIVVLPKSKRAVIVATNGDNGLILCNNIIRAALAEGDEIVHKSYRSGNKEDMPSISPMHENELLKYVGDFVQPSGREVEITSIDGGLMMKMPGAPLLHFYPASTDTFFLRDFDAQLAFSLDQSGEVIEAILIDGENSIHCKKAILDN